MLTVKGGHLFLRSKMKKILLIFLFFVGQKALSVTILIHGTFAKNETWFQPQGDFYRAYISSLKEEQLIPFVWSGKLSHEERLKAAHDLSKQIIACYPDNVTVIAHSHGGNVVNLASHLLEAASYSIQNAYQEPVTYKINAMLKLFMPELVFVQYDFPFSYSREIFQSFDPQEQLKSLLSEKIRSLSEYMIEIGGEGRFVKKKYVIDRAQYLAVPVMIANYAPNMKIIERLEHYYAENDWIQLCGGTEGHRYATHPRITQFKVLFTDAVKVDCVYDADHFSIHNEIVAKWLAKSDVIDYMFDQGKNYSLILHKDATLSSFSELLVKKIPLTT